MNGAALISRAKNTWCPGCGNFVIQHALKEVFTDLANEGLLPLENVVLVAGIGQHG
ncbi:MAG: 2-oxoacid:ferredoxin oxidoreductase subunit beta, partial [Methanomicrobiales archaeon]|nr:2-oxoacid:ferredoxin oxidoreductase subunit beta [Methanomicrobiales archaeon]